MGLIALLTFAGCSDDTEQRQQRLQMEAVASAPGYMEAEAEARGSMEEGYHEGGTRAWVPPTIPTQYYLYDVLYSGSLYANYKSLNNMAIDVFFTHTGEGGLTTSPNPLHARLRYVPAAPPAVSKWKLVLPNPVKEDDVKAGSYYVYGFIPRNAADGATITGNPTFDEGAVLTIEGLQSITSDACVIIGAKEGFSADYDGDWTDTNHNDAYDDGTDIRTNRLTAGDFKFNLKTGESANNYMYLLFDHLCSALDIRMRVYKDYDDLRTIKLKELHLQTATDEGKTKKKMNVTVTLKKTADGGDPIKSVVYEPTGEEECDGIVYQDEEGTRLSTDYSLFLCHFIPLGTKKLILTSTYDVYDKNVTLEHPEGNLIRANCKATNTIDITKKIDRLKEVKRGYKYTINMTIQPTYLYMLSEPDLDSPTVTVE